MWEKKPFATVNQPDDSNAEGKVERGRGCPNSQKNCFVITVAENTDSPLQQFMLCALLLYLFFILFVCVRPLEKPRTGEHEICLFLATKSVSLALRHLRGMQVRLS